MRRSAEKNKLHIPVPELRIQHRLLGLVMTMKSTKPTLSEEVEKIDAAAAYDEKAFSMDPKGYFLIRINPETGKIEVGHCRQNNVILKVFSGNTSKELMQAILREGIVSRLEHAGYLGRETMKAQIAKELEIEYVQDSELEIRR